MSTLSRRVSMTTIQESIVDGPLNKLNKLARSAWQSILVTGVLSVLLGVVVLAWPGPTLVVAGVAFGIYLVASGLLQLISAFGLHADAGLRILAFISGILSLVLGYFCFNSTLESILLLAIWIGISWLFRGLTVMIAAISDPDMPSRGWQIFFGIVVAIGGGVLVWAPFDSIAVLALTAGCALIVIGLLEMITAFRVRRSTAEVRDKMTGLHASASEFRSSRGDLAKGA
ncbi:HdeD family acid-resistance protein [Nocardia seriolae]|nr:HdeD family acid-resistance protein [Nocardia seriolae]